MTTEKEFKSLPEGFSIALSRGMLMIVESPHPEYHTLSSVPAYYLANPDDHPGRWNKTGAFCIQFGAYACTMFLVWAGSFDDALEIAAEAAKEAGFDGLFTEPDYADAAKELELDPETEDEDGQEKIREHAETDLTYTESGWIASYEWHGHEVTEGPLLQALEAVSAARGI